MSKPPKRSCYLAIADCLCMVVWFARGLAAHAGTPTFNHDVRPILAENCFACHGPDERQRQADLRLDQRESAIAAGVLVPGDAAASDLIDRVLSDDPDYQMPPPITRKQLTGAQKQLLRAWIDAGANYERHWSFLPPIRNAVPKVSGRADVRSPIDSFVLSKQRDRLLPQVQEADRATLLRRVSLDLTGLPPTESELLAFEADPSPQAYEAVVQRLLSSPHFGERWAIPWLDVARYADTVGYHGDQNQNVFPYRDWVIDALNHNMPFDQFTIEQLAGDLLPQPTMKQLVATGFNRLNMMTREGGAQPEEYLAKYAADRVRTVAGAWLGVTLGCAECHDHKYDPFPTSDFYQLSAFFADIKQWGVYQDYPYTPNADLRGWSNDHPWPPELDVEVPYLRTRQTRLLKRWQQLAEEDVRAVRSQSELRDSFKIWDAATRSFLHDHPDGWLAKVPNIAASSATPPDQPSQEGRTGAETENKAATSTSATNALVSVGDAGDVIVADGGPSDIEFTMDGAIPLTDQRQTDVISASRPQEELAIASIRLEFLRDEQRRGEVFHGPDGQPVIMVQLQVIDGQGGVQEIPVAMASADHAVPRYYNGYEILGIHTGWQVAVNPRAMPHGAVWVLQEPLKVSAESRLKVRIIGSPANRIRVSVSPFAPCLAGSTELTCVNSAPFVAASDDARRTALFILSTTVLPDRRAKYRELQLDLWRCNQGKWPTLITEPVPPRLTRVLPRGNWQDESGPLVVPGFPTALCAEPKSNRAGDVEPGVMVSADAGPVKGDSVPESPNNVDDRRLTRLDLARWLVSSDQPLTARVQMNRLWKELMGRGICSTLDDLGTQGEPPTHPELLDWLAEEFVSSGWDFKHMVREIVLSATYRQAAANSMAVRTSVDPDGRWYSGQNPRRLPAELVRDNALAVAGILCRDRGGPPVFPHQPAGYYEHLQFPDREYQPQTDERQWRRGVYMHWQRTFLHPMLANFDAPAREECTGQRFNSNSPQQALTLLNDPTFVTCAAALGDQASAWSAEQPDDECLHRLFRRAVARDPSAEELASLVEFLHDQRAHFSAHADDAVALARARPNPNRSSDDHVAWAAWCNTCRVILNLHEFTTLY